MLLNSSIWAWLASLCSLYIVSLEAKIQFTVELFSGRPALCIVYFSGTLQPCLTCIKLTIFIGGVWTSQTWFFFFSSLFPKSDTVAYLRIEKTWWISALVRRQQPAQFLSCNKIDHPQKLPLDLKVSSMAQLGCGPSLRLRGFCMRA